MSAGLRPSRQLESELRRFGNPKSIQPNIIPLYLSGQSNSLVNYAERDRAGLCVGRALSEATENFLVNRRMKKIAAMRRIRRGANLLLQVRRAIYNGALGTVSGQRSAPDFGLPPQIAMAA
jgi:hypothetical protein